MNDVSTTSKIIDQCRHENTNPMEMDFSAGGCTFTIDADDVRDYYIECDTGNFAQIIK